MKRDKSDERAENSNIADDIACVTGATGTIGKRIVKKLLADGWRVRALTRGGSIFDERIEVLIGDLCDENTLRGFMSGADVLYHCAAELEDESRMWEVNVEGTRNLINCAAQSEIKNICFMSSAGVVGNVKDAVVDESTECNPYSTYEKSKWAAETAVIEGLEGCHVVILRPTNVVAEEKLGVMGIMRGGLKNRIKLFIKGGEYAHVVHADDVANAAIHLMAQTISTPQCYFISYDDECMSTYAGIDFLYRACRRTAGSQVPRRRLHLPVGVTHIIRWIYRGRRNRGDIRYSSNKLFSTGFRFNRGLEGLISNMAEGHR